jgi:aminoglycoside phosphotransferase (APT) family kinase protein
LRHGDREYVLRRPPFGSKVKSAHDMGREFTVLTKLWPVYGCAPRPFAYESTGDVLGAPFYLMERRRGVVLRKDLPESLTSDLPRVRRVCELLVDALVDLHAVDYSAAGLADFGKPVGYIERQVTGWTKRYADSQTDDIPAVTEGNAWLAAHLPAEGPPALIHNDFKFDNVIFDPALSSITGVLDWEMATLGPAEVDVGWFLFFQGFFSEGLGVPDLPGFPRRAAALARYETALGRKLDDLFFYEVFAAWRNSTVMLRIADIYEGRGFLSPESGAGQNNVATRLLARMLDLPSPGEPGGPFG